MIVALSSNQFPLNQSVFYANGIVLFVDTEFKTEVKLNIYFSELAHTLALAEKSAVSIRQVKVGTKSSAGQLSIICEILAFLLRFGFQLGLKRKNHAIGGCRNSIFILNGSLQSSFSLHWSSIISSCLEEVGSRPNKLVSTLIKDMPSQIKSRRSLSSWFEHYKKEFSAPYLRLKNSY